MVKKSYKFARGFEQYAAIASDRSYGLCTAPLPAQQAINLLVTYLLGDDYYISMPMNGEQCNTIIVDNILDKYSRRYRKDVKRYLKRKAKNALDTKTN